MTLNELIESTALHVSHYHSSGATKAHVDAVLRALGDVVGAELVEGGEVTLPGLGKLKTDQRAARTGRNPATGEALEIPAKTVVKFSPAKALKDALA